DLGRAGELANRPDATFGARAHDAALYADPAQGVPVGSIGAGAGAVAGGLRGGVGSASVVLADGSTLGALVVCNAAGSPLDADTGELSGTRYGLPGEFDHLRPPSAEDLAAHQATTAEATTLNTTVAVIATDVALDKARCTRMAMLGHDGLARAVRPVHTLVDGDTVFAAATGTRAQPDFAGMQQLLGAAADAVARATAHALLAATSASTPVGTWSAYRDRFPSAFDTG
ncbi:MAG: P1 family peptidase, partial [Nitriliruptoraceae bacterium]